MNAKFRKMRKTEENYEINYLIKVNVLERVADGAKQFRLSD